MSELIFQEENITVTETHRGDVIGNEYRISDGINSFTQSEMPMLSYGYLKKQIINYIFEKKQSHFVPADEDADYYEMK